MQQLIAIAVNIFDTSSIFNDSVERSKDVETTITTITLWTVAQ